MGANKLIGVEMNDYRIDLAKKLGLADYVFKPGEDTLEKILEVTDGKGVERAIDASANDAGRQLAIRATREWGKIAFVGEGGTCTFNPSPDIIHGQKTIYGSWVTSLWRMEELVERLVRWNIHSAFFSRKPLMRGISAEAAPASVMPPSPGRGKAESVIPCKKGG